ncbi:S-adenosyl-L-methionine-dependent methyltransferase [Gymnopus androsaceus JB14]|uniref:S-adenosyl-L-methionine-dependent methyltransferase n=1 Tax=Gymnopus androsaceus JB14 TaxID=1447944 RepID=A0A6A4GLN3_9AGAR|nr:S-adenosyl-L-methionine-dependent methyltransferase [Gymnopus androsaceus JB14]
MHEGRAAIPFFPELVSKKISESSSQPTPSSAFSIYSNGQSFYEWLHSPPQVERNVNFNLAMRSVAQTEGLAFLPVDYPFNALPVNKVIVDVGGGIGALPAALLPSLPDHSFIVQDLAPVVSQANSTEDPCMRDWIMKGKVRFCIQDFFAPQPPELNGAVFVIKNVINRHNYGDSEALNILLSLRKSTPYRLLLIDRLVIPQLGKIHKVQATEIAGNAAGSQRGATLYDLVMASLHGGKNRTLEEWSRLLVLGGFRLESVFPLRASTGQAVIEATCIEGS